MTIVEKIGLPALMEQCAEECAELAQACLKISRLYRGENPTPKSMEDCRIDLEEELADVLLVMGMIIDELGIDPNGIQDTCDFKLKRWNDRVDEAEALVKKVSENPDIFARVNPISADELRKVLGKEDV